MARKFVTIEEAAQTLGVSVDEINEMRERGEIHAYRDGGSWKFREDEVERVQADRAGGGGDDFGLGLDDSPDSVLLDEGALGGSGKSGGSTIIGGKPAVKPSESDLELSLDAGGSSPSAKGAKPASAIGAAFEDLDDLSLDLDAGSVKGKAAGGSAIDLSGGEDDDLVLEPAADSDITRQAGDSGIQLAAPADSGLSLEQPLEIGGSSVDSFELGEGSAISFEEKAPADAPTQVKSGDDDFLLTPMQSADDDEDSGSQVIALDEDEGMEVEGASSPRAGAGLLEEDEDTVSPAGRTAAAGETVYVTAPEAPYTGWNVTALALCTLVLLFAGMMTFELLRHMWSWEEPFVANGAIMDVIAGWFK